jgi:hypothetical protein
MPAHKQTACAKSSYRNELKEFYMSNVPSVSSSDDAIASMQAAFDEAIEKSAKITEVTTEKKTELDATKQRPQN